MIGQTISHYRIVAKLGEGGMGVVYKAEDTRLERTVALKFLGGQMIADEDGRRRFIREAKAAASLDHPNICTVYEIDEAEGRIFIAMPYIEGRSLTEAIAAGPMKLPEALDIARQAARGLQEAHSKGIVHRDIKPPNIMIGSTGSGERLVKIMDFGLAQLSGVSKLTRVDTTLGTIAYMSPEQTQGTLVDHRSDIWSLGAVLYEMASGQQAFKGHYEQAVMYSILNEDPEPITAVRAGLPMEFEWILGKALAKAVDRRYQSALEFAVDLETLLARLQTGGSTAARSTMRPAVPPALRPENAGSLSGPRSQASADNQSQQRRRRIRDYLLELAAQGLLPDRVLSQALESLAKPAEQRLPADDRRQELLEDLVQSRRVGEFIDNWQRVEALPASAGASGPPVAQEPVRSAEPVRTEAPASSASAAGGGPIEMSVPVAETPASLEQPAAVDVQLSREWRTKAQIFGLPLVHCVRGSDQRTGKRRVAKGIVAAGPIAVGLIACGGVAIGGLTLGAVSIGLVAAGAGALGLLLSFGVLAVGPYPFGVVTSSLTDLLFSGALRVILLIFLLRLWMRSRRFRKRHGEDGGAFSIWSALGAREWRSDGTPFRGGHAVATMGACEIDLTGATINGPEAVIEATAVFGALKIVVPYGWRIVTNGTQLLGGYANKTRPPQPAASGPSPRLLVKGFALVGAVEVTHPETN